MMQSFWAAFRFEFLQLRRHYSNYIYFGIQIAFAILLVLFAGGAFPGVSFTFGGSQKAFLNSPFSIMNFFQLIGVMGGLVAAPIFGLSVCRDYESRMDAILFATPIRVKAFYLGRLLACFLVGALIVTGGGVGFFVATQLPQIQTSQLTANELMPYLWPYISFLWPNVFIFGSVAFLTAAWSRSMTTVSVVILLFFMTNFFATAYGAKMEAKTLRALIDPFGSNAFKIVTEYWSIAEQNTRMVKLEGLFLWNRVLWMSLSFVLLLLGLFLVQRPRQVKQKKKEYEPHPTLILESLRPPLDFSFGARMHLLFSQAWYESKLAMRNANFVTVVIVSVFYVFLTAPEMAALWGTEIRPLMPNLLEVNGLLFSIFVKMILAFYTADLLWRERQARMSQIIDALPLPTWLSVLTKFLALQIIAVALLGILYLCCLVLQLQKGFFQPDVLIAAQRIYTMDFMEYFVLGAIIYCIHVLTNHKYLGHTVVSIYFALRIWLPKIGVEHPLFLPASNTHSATYSFLNGFGDLAQLRAFQVYWAIFALIMLLVAYLGWVRGAAGENRWKIAKGRWNRPLLFAAAMIGLIFVGQGSYIYHNTNVLNDYESSDETKKKHADYEKIYAPAFRGKPGLKISSVNADVEIFPKRGGMKAAVQFQLENRTGQALSEVLVNVPVDLELVDLQWDQPVTVKANDELETIVVTFATPVPPGGKVQLQYGLDYFPSGFPAVGRRTKILRNGTFFGHHDFFPSFGYGEAFELTEKKDRKKEGLPEKRKMPGLMEPGANHVSYFGAEADWIDFEARITTDADQIAIAPGDLQGETLNGDRKTFHYRMAGKILNFYAFQSASYQLREDRWKDVALKIYYQKGHEFNLDSMMMALKDGLDYFTREFGPYPHKELRIVEFPRYATFAQSFPGTIPFSENIGFIARVDPKDPKDVNYPYYVTAHELAHQWWGHQLVPSYQVGGTMLAESLSQYSALMVMQKRFGRDSMDRFLMFERDKYLKARSTEREKEKPLMLNENQSYIYYEKGSLLFFALKELIGESLLNEVLRDLLAKFSQRSAPFANTADFMSLLKGKTDPALHEGIDDLLARISFCDLRLLKRTVMEDQVELDIFAKKVYVDGEGNETEAVFDRGIEVGFQGPKEAWIGRQTVTLKDGDNRVTLPLPKDTKAIILDPLSLCLDKNQDDNKTSL